MLRWRISLGVLVVAALVALSYLDAAASRPGVVLAPLAIVLGALCAGEMLRIFQATPDPPSTASVYLGVLLPIGASCLPLAWSSYPADCPVGKLGWLAIGLAIAVMSIMAIEMRHPQGPAGAIGRTAKGAFASLYVGGLLGMLVQLRLLEDRGLTALLHMIFIVKASDVGQYVTGRLIGRTKLAPQLSPGKTWEGLAGGLFFAVAASWALGTSQGPKSAVCAIALALAGVCGDLAESLLKRDACIKDSSSWLPGFGGVLDLVDSLLFAGPIAYLCWTAGWMH